MKHFPIYLSMDGHTILVAGGGDAAVAKLRLLLKTTARLRVFADSADAQIRDWAAQGRLEWLPRGLQVSDAAGARLIYAAAEDTVEDARIAAIGAEAGVLTNIVDNLADSDFITPAIVDRDPVTVAIGTEGAAPVLARAIKADLEARLPQQLGVLARIGKLFRPLADRLPMGRKRRDFWADYYFDAGPRALEQQGEAALNATLAELLFDHHAAAARPGRVDFVGAGPGDPELLTLKARKLLDKADVVLHDRLVSPQILELARREALLVDVGKEGFGPSTPQERIHQLMAEHAGNGAHVVRLKAGDPGVFARLDEEIGALEEVGIAWAIHPGITAAAAGAAQIGQPLTARGRNTAVRFMTGHDMKGFADHDWRALARPGEVAAIYMGKRSARFAQGRLLMHGADPATPVSVVENVSRPDTRVVGTTLAELPAALDDINGPAVILFGLAPRAAASITNTFASKELAL
ncbi:siroheme synthase CysG [Actibacterium ureilyticum]|uniref:siroheme synthase CysG n=1 Tax=Actibacterium ureilyticum TaxID=1590614 RepID=UPI000BAB1821|nr:siroheme synthase CysG [Actibacterium ureilyticum]